MIVHFWETKDTPTGVRVPIVGRLRFRSLTAKSGCSGTIRRGVGLMSFTLGRGLSEWLVPASLVSSVANSILSV